MCAFRHCPASSGKIMMRSNRDFIGWGFFQDDYGFAFSSTTCSGLSVIELHSPAGSISAFSCPVLVVLLWTTFCHRFQNSNSRRFRLGRGWLGSVCQRPRRLCCRLGRASVSPTPEGHPVPSCLTWRLRQSGTNTRPRVSLPDVTEHDNGQYNRIRHCGFNG